MESPLSIFSIIYTLQLITNCDFYTLLQIIKEATIMDILLYREKIFSRIEIISYN